MIEIFSDVSVYVSLSIGIMVFIIAIAFMLSRFLRKPDIEGWARLESFELVKNVVIALFIIGFYYSLEFAGVYIGDNSGLFSAVGFSGNVPQGRSKVVVADTYVLKKIVYDKALPTLIKVGDTYNFIEFIAGYKEDWGAPKVIGISFTSYPGAKFLSRALAWSMYIMKGIFVSLLAQLIGLNLIYDISLKFLLPFGLLLRFYPPLRSAGDEMIGMAISFGLILPFLYLLSYAMIANVETLNGHSNLFAPVSTEPVGGNLLQKVAREISDTYNSIRDVLGSVISVIKYSVFGAVFVYAYPLIFRTVVEPIGYVAMVGLMIPTFLYMISASFVKAIKSVLNFELEGTLVI